MMSDEKITLEFLGARVMTLTAEVCERNSASPPWSTASPRWSFA